MFDLFVEYEIGEDEEIIFPGWNDWCEKFLADTHKIGLVVFRSFPYDDEYYRQALRCMRSFGKICKDEHKDWRVYVRSDPPRFRISQLLHKRRDFLGELSYIYEELSPGEGIVLLLDFAGPWKDTTIFLSHSLNFLEEASKICKKLLVVIRSQDMNLLSNIQFQAFRPYDIGYDKEFGLSELPLDTGEEGGEGEATKDGDPKKIAERLLAGEIVDLIEVEKKFGKDFEREIVASAINIIGENKDNALIGFNNLIRNGYIEIARKIYAKTKEGLVEDEKSVAKSAKRGVLPEWIFIVSELEDKLNRLTSFAEWCVGKYPDYIPVLHAAFYRLGLRKSLDINKLEDKYFKPLLKSVRLNDPRSLAYAYQSYAVILTNRNEFGRAKTILKEASKMIISMREDDIREREFWDRAYRYVSVQRATIYRRLGDSKRADKKVERLLDKKGVDDAVLCTASAIAVDRYRLNTAYNYIRKMQEGLPYRLLTEATIFKEKYRVLAEDKYYDEALKLLNRLISLNPNNIKVLTALSSLKRLRARKTEDENERNELVKESKELIERARKLDSDNVFVAMETFWLWKENREAFGNDEEVVGNAIRVLDRHRGAGVYSELVDILEHYKKYLQEEITYKDLRDKLSDLNLRHSNYVIVHNQRADLYREIAERLEKEAKKEGRENSQLQKTVEDLMKRATDALESAYKIDPGNVKTLLKRWKAGFQDDGAEDTIRKELGVKNIEEIDLLTTEDIFVSVTPFDE